MVQRIGGARRKTRFKLQKEPRQRGKLSIKKFLTSYAVGDRVVLQAEPSIQGGMYYRRFHGSVGTVKAQQGKCYQVIIKDKDKQKVVLVHPVHLKKNVEA